MPRPFPFPINVGTDICSVQRIFRLIAERGPTTAFKFPRKILTADERAARVALLWAPLNQWWDLQKKKREEFGVGHVQPLRRAQWDQDFRGKLLPPGAGKVASLNIFEGPQRFSSQRRSDDLESRSREDEGAADLESSRESMTGIPEDVASLDDVEVAAAVRTEPSSELWMGVSAGPLFQKRAESKAAEAASTQSTEGEGPETPVASESLLGGEAAAITDQQEQREGNSSISRGRELIDDKLKKLYPDMWNAAQFLAGRFAAKEAAIKAYQTRRLTYQDIQIVLQPPLNGMTQAPIAMVVSKDGDWDDAQIIPMSISHDGGFATAVCMAYEKSAGAVFETADEIENSLSSMAKKKKGPATQTRRSE